MSMRQNGRTRAFRTKTRECLGELTFVECGDREHLGGGDDTLSSPTMEADLEHESASRYLRSAEPTNEARSAKRLE